MRIGVDLGGTKTEIVALDERGNARLRRRVVTPSQDYPAIVETIGSLVEAAERELAERGSVGVAAPGAASRKTGLVKNANSTALNGRPLAADLCRRLRRDVRVANDANCFALSEAADGAGAGAPSVFGVILGTGVGGGVVYDGKIVEGRNAIAGEWGHNPLPWPGDDERPGPGCYCGKHGCIETFLAGPALARDHAFHGGSSSDAATIAAAAFRGDHAAQQTLERYVDRLARALAHVVNLLDPDRIVLGGGLSNLAFLYDELPLRLPAYVFSDTVETAIVRAAHGDSSGVRGAAWLWPQSQT